MTKLQKILEIEGFDDVTELIEEALFDGTCPAICIKEGCDYTENMEPDQDRGWCPECEANTLKSAMVLAGVI